MKNNNLNQLKKDLALPDYKIDYKVNCVGGCLQGYINTAYWKLEKLFGTPQVSDGFKISGEWVFKDVNSETVFYLYDWKRTDLYDSAYQTVEEFRKDIFSKEFNVGGSENPTKFILWLEAKLATVKEK